MLTQQEHFSPTCPATGRAFNSFLQRGAFLVMGTKGKHWKCEHTLDWKDRFWKKVDKNGPIPAHRPELGPCWIWKGGRHNKDYGGLYINGTHNLAHRLAYFLGTGKRPVLFVCHHCDRRICVRPSHLFEGTNGDNMRDAAKKGAFSKPRPERRGELNPMSILTLKQVNAIRNERRTQGTTFAALAEKYKMSLTGIVGVVKYRTWASF